MPIAKIKLPDGRIGRFEVPDGTTPDQVLAYAAQAGLGQERGVVTRLLDAPARGLADMAISTARGAAAAESTIRGIPQDEAALSGVTRALEKSAADIPRPTSLPGEVGQAVGSTIGYLAGAPIRGGGALLGAIGGAGEQQQRIEQYEKETGKKVESGERVGALLKGAGAGLAEGILPEAIAGRIPGLKKVMEGSSRLGRAGAGAAVEGVSELGGNVAQDVTEQGYNENKVVELADSLKQGGLGAAAGGIISGILPGRGAAPSETPPKPTDTQDDGGLARRLGLEGSPEAPVATEAAPEQDMYAEEAARRVAEIERLTGSMSNPNGKPKDLDPVDKLKKTKISAHEKRVKEIADYQLALDKKGDKEADEIITQFEAKEAKRVADAAKKAENEPERLPPGSEEITMEGGVDEGGLPTDEAEAFAINELGAAEQAGQVEPQVEVDTSGDVENIVMESGIGGDNAKWLDEALNGPAEAAPESTVVDEQLNDAGVVDEVPGSEVNGALPIREQALIDLSNEEQSLLQQYETTQDIEQRNAIDTRLAEIAQQKPALMEQVETGKAQTARDEFTQETDRLNAEYNDLTEQHKAVNTRIQKAKSPQERTAAKKQLAALDTKIEAVTEQLSDRVQRTEALKGPQGRTRASKETDGSESALTPEIAKERISSTFGKGVQTMVDDGTINFVNSYEDIPSHVREDYESTGGTSDGVSALFFPGSESNPAQAFIVTSRTPEASLQKVILHEIGEHYGLINILGEKQYTNFLNRIVNSKDKSVKDAIAYVEKVYKHLDKNSLEFKSEVAARLAETTDIRKQLWYKEIADAVRRWLVKQGFTKNVTADDVHALVRQVIQKGVKGGTKSPASTRAAKGTKQAIEEGVVNTYEWTARSTIRSAADNLMNSDSPVLKKLGRAISTYVDEKARLHAASQKVFGPAWKAFRKSPNYKADNALLTDFWNAYTHGDKKVLADTLSKISPDGKKYISSTIDTLETLGDLAVKSGVKVIRNGQVQPFQKMKNYYPLVVSHEYADAIRFPTEKRNTEKVMKIADWLESQGKLQLQPGESKLQATQRLLTSEHQKISKLDDFYGNLERGRTGFLPPFVYDYSADSMKQYIHLATDRLAQVNAFGQSIGQQKNLFQEALASQGVAGTEKLKGYIKKAAQQIYGMDVETNNPIRDWRLPRILGTATTGLALGAPGGTTNNLIGGMGNVAGFSDPITFARGMLPALREFKRSLKEGYDIGLIRDDILNIHDNRTLVESGMKPTEILERKVVNPLTDKALGFFQFRNAENFLRANASANIAKTQLKDALKWNKDGTDKAKLRVFKERIEREGIDFDKLVEEDGNVTADNETGKYVRKMVNLMQGSYDLDQIPLYVNSPLGRLMFKFWKFNTQQSRLAEREFLVPMAKAWSEKGYTNADRAYRTFRFLNFMASGALSGTAMNSLRFFSNPAAEPYRAINAASKGEWGDAASAAFAAGMQATVLSGTLGLASMVAESLGWLEDVLDDDIHTRNFGSPVTPATAGIAMSMVDFGYELAKALTDDDKQTDPLQVLNQHTKKLVRAYREGTQIRDVTAARLNRDDYDNASEMGKYAINRIDSSDSQRYMQNWLEKIDYIPKNQKPRGLLEILTGEEPFSVRKNSKLKTEVYDAILEGNSQRAKQLMSEATQGMDKKAKKSIEDSIKKSLKWRHPLNVEGADPNAIGDIRRAFLGYMAEEYGEKTALRLATSADRYEKLIKDAGLYEK